MLLTPHQISYSTWLPKQGYISQKTFQKESLIRFPINRAPAAFAETNINKLRRFFSQINQVEISSVKLAYPRSEIEKERDQEAICAPTDTADFPN